ncbi:MAG: FHA domain-containing protein [Candidatus Saccharibacteria bacterium]|nr:FHA domain-containing protein [Rhodoferax sp.]
MSVQTTIVFTDLHGSTAVFEALGNAKATAMVTEITHWIAHRCEANGGRVVKTLGDGVLAMFPNPQSAVDTVVDIQRANSKSVTRSSKITALPIRIGVASGEVEVLQGDCYGDAVNVASRLCDLCGPNQIWANSSALERAVEVQGVTFRALGLINVRGRAEPCKVFQLEWREEQASDFLTMQGDLDPQLMSGERDILGREIELTYLDTSQTFKAFDLPVAIGRVRSAQFVVNDPRVSRTHVRIDWRNGSIVLVDLSSYGSWVRFGASSNAPVLLRREECVLHGSGVLALGASFSDLSVPTVSFQVR